MKHDTSFTRVIFLTLFCFIIFPFIYQFIAQFRAASTLPNKFEGMEVISEYELVKSHVGRFVANQGMWPKTLAEANYFSQEQLVNFDLSEPWSLKAKISHKTLLDELEGRQLSFILNPNSGVWRCDKSFTNIPERYSPESCDGELNKIFYSITAKTWSLLLATSACLMIFLLAVYRHPLLKMIRKNNFSLSKTAFHELHKLKLLAFITGHTKPILKANNLSHSDWKKIHQHIPAIPVKLIKSLTQTLPIELIKTETKISFRFRFTDQFEFNIKELLILVIDEQNTNKIIKRINQITDPLTPLLIWVNNPISHVELRVKADQINKPCLIPTQQQMTQLLIFQTAKPTLLKLAAKHLPLSSISPYQGKGGITKSSHFFGRQGILNKLETQFQTHFLLVGGRQLGKTSLLKALHRKLKQQANNHCLYLSLSDDRLLPRLAYHTGIKKYSDLTDLIQQIQQKNPGRKIRLLIDEADLFIQSEVDTDFKILNQIRQSAEHQQCQFIFAGFWQLYANAVIDYHSPLRNMAYSITVSALEPEPGRQLISQPMKMLGQQFKNPELIDDIYHRTGGRANLINLICEYLIEQLTHHQQPIDAALITQAYQSDRVLDALQGWSNLSADEASCRLDRIVVYMTFIHQKIDLQTISHTLQQNTLRYNPEDLKQSIQRLRLAHIIKKNNTQYEFAVPLFAQQHDNEEARVLIKQEFLQLKS